MVVNPNNHFFTDPQFVSHAEGGKKIALQGERMVWLTEREIQEQHAQKLSLEAIAELAKTLDSNHLNDDESTVLSRNLKWLNSKINNHKEKINEDLLIKIFNFIIDKILTLFSASSLYHTYQTIDESIDKIQQAHLQKHPLLQQYRGKSFIQENRLAGRLAQMTEAEIGAVMQLFFLFHEETCQEIQNDPTLRQIVIDQLKKSTDKFARQAEKALMKMEELGDHVRLDGLLKVLMFVEKNRAMMDEGKIGKVAKSRSEIRKFKATSYQIPFDIEYDTKKGDILVTIGKLRPGGFKFTVKKRLLLGNLEMDVLGKQVKTVTAEREIEFMQAAKGLPHVVTLHEVATYRSQKKEGLEVMTTSVPFYRGGDLLDYLDKHPLSDLEMYQILSDIIKALLGLHDRGIIHRDIKPENIFLRVEMVNGIPTIRPVVGDLGLACMSQGDPNSQKLVGTPAYIPPEVLQRQQPATFAFDAWSLGALAYVLKHRTLKFTAEKRENIAKQQNRLADPSENPEPQDKSSIQYVIWKLLKIDPNQRMDLAEADRIVDALLAKAKQTAAAA